MSQEKLRQTDWANGLSQCLQDLVDYERWLERELSRLRRRAENALGVHDSRDDWDDRIRERISGYWRSLEGTPRADSEYQRRVSERLNRLLEVLLDHPTLKNAVYRAEGGQLSLVLNLGVSWVSGHPLHVMLMGLIDHAVEHGSQATADALSQVIQRGEDEDLNSYQILLFRGLHVEQRHDFPNGLSIVSFEEVRRYLADDSVREMLEAGDTEINREPIGAVVFERKWGPVFVPAGYDMDGVDWPERSRTFRHDALLLLDALAVSHGVPVVGTRTQTTVVERQIEHLMGRDPLVSRILRDVVGANTMRIEPIATPGVSEEKLADCERLLLSCRDDVQSRLALSRLASSLARTSVHEAFDKVLDVAIALEVMYRLDVSRGKGSQLSRHARNLIGGDREDLNWIRRTAESIYAARTGVIHDGTLLAGADQIYVDAFELGRRTLLHLAGSGNVSNRNGK